MVLGLVVLAVAVFAIRNPHGGSGTAAADTTTSATPAPRPSSASHPSRSTHPTKSLSGSKVPITTGATSGSVGAMPLQQAQRTPLVVLNNSTISGLAAQTSQQFRDAGWTVSSYGNLQNDIISTCAYYDPSVRGARAAAEVLRHQFPGIKRVRPKFPQLPAGPIVVVLTSGYSAQ